MSALYSIVFLVSKICSLRFELYVTSIDCLNYVVPVGTVKGFKKWIPKQYLATIIMNAQIFLHQSSDNE